MVSPVDKEKMDHRLELMYLLFTLVLLKFPSNIRGTWNKLLHLHILTKEN